MGDSVAQPIWAIGLMVVKFLRQNGLGNKCALAYAQNLRTRALLSDILIVRFHGGQGREVRPSGVPGPRSTLVRSGGGAEGYKGIGHKKKRW